jgi:GNAT superfamily N-acetyltransferase
LGRETLTPPQLSRPERLLVRHRLNRFQSGEPSIDEWLIQRAAAAEGRTARTYVVASGDDVVAYYALAAASVERRLAPKSMQRRTPDSIPVAIIARLGVSRDLQGQGYGLDLLRDAILRVVSASEIIGIRAILVHALRDDVADFYLRYGFRVSPMSPRTLFLDVETARAGM